MPMLIVMVGFPGSGKTYQAGILKKRKSFVHLCVNDFYKDGNSDSFNAVAEDDAYHRLGDECKRLLKEGQSVICDAPFLTKHRRKSLLGRLKRIKGLRKICVIVERSVPSCAEALSKDGRKNSKEILKKMEKQYEEPRLEEGWTKILRINTEAVIKAKKRQKKGE